MSISFASPPKIVRETTPPVPGSSTDLTGRGSVEHVSPSGGPYRRERHGSHSSMRSNISDSTNRRPRSPDHMRFEKRVSFSTLDNEEASMVSFTLKTKHEAHQYSRRSRAFLIGFNDDEYSTSAMEWLIDTMADDGDEIIALRVIDPSRCRPRRTCLETNTYLGSSLSADDTEEVYRAKARTIQTQIIKMNEDDKEISIVVELAVGNVKSLLLRLMHLYHPDSLIVGTKGRSLNGLAGLRPNSISKWCLQNSPIPVIVVRPDRKRSKAKEKRLQDPNRRSYLEILENSQSFENLNTMLGRQNLAPVSSETSANSLHVPRPDSAGRLSRDGRPQASNAGSENSPRGKSPLGRITSKISRVLGD